VPPSDSPAPGGEYRVRLEAFEGPLDLLLHLVRASDVEITDIPIVRITDQYLQYLDFLKEVDIDLSSDFMLLAATLIYIKTRMLLPRHEGEEDPRAELVERLLEHEQYRAASAVLGSRAQSESRFWHRPSAAKRPFLEGEEVEIEADLFDLITAFRRVLAALGEDSTLAVDHQKYTLDDKIAEVERALAAKPKLFFSELAASYSSRRELITVFLAILELMRRPRLRLLQTEHFGEIVLARRDGEQPNKG